jgi:rsbT co-antagonist protein RsbR
MKKDIARSALQTASAAGDASQTILKEAVVFLKAGQPERSASLAQRIQHESLLKDMAREAIASEAAAFYASFVSSLESGVVDTIDQYSRDLSQRTIPFGVQTHQVVNLLLVLR